MSSGSDLGEVREGEEEAEERELSDERFRREEKGVVGEKADFSCLCWRRCACWASRAG